MSLYHVKSNTIADVTGTVTVYNSLGSTQTVEASNLVRPSDWNSGHNIIYNLSGNTAGSSQVSGLDIALVGGNNITLSADTAASKLVFQAAGAGAGGSVNFSAGTTSGNLASVVFSNSNGMSFGLDGATITGSHNGLTSQSNQALSGSNGSFAFQTATFGNLNGMSFYTSNGSMVGSYTVPSTAGLLSNINVSAGTTSNNLSALTFSDSNGVSFGLNGSVVTATVKTDYLTSQSNQAVSANNGSYAFQTLSFSNANGVSFGTSAGSAITASHNGLTSQSNQAFSAQGGSSAFQTLSFNNANGATFSNNAGAVEISYTRPVVSNAIASVGSATNSGTNTSRFAADDHVHAGVFSVGVSNVGNTSGDTRVDVGRFVFAGGNNITLSQGTAANALNTITISAAAQTNQTMGIYASSNTTGQSSSSTVDARSLTFRGIGVASVGMSAGEVLISVPAGGGGITNINLSAGTTSNNASNFTFADSNGVSFGLNASTITASHNGLTSQSNQALSGSNGSFTFQTATFGNLNNMSFYTSNGSMVGSANIATMSYWQRAEFGSYYTATDTIQDNTHHSIVPFFVQAPLAMSYFRMMAFHSLNTSNNTSSAYQDQTARVVIYTRDASTLNSILSGSMTRTGSWNSNATESIQGMRQIVIPFASSTILTPGQYWAMVNISTTYTATNTSTATRSNVVLIQPFILFTNANANYYGGDFGISSDANSSNNAFLLGLGIVGTNATMDSLAFSNISISRRARANLWFELKNYTMY